MECAFLWLFVGKEHDGLQVLNLSAFVATRNKVHLVAVGQLSIFHLLGGEVDA